MSPTAALDSTVFRIYLGIALGMLGVAGATLAVLDWGFRRNVSHAWTSYRGWLMMIPLIVAAIFLGRIPTIIFLTVVAVFGFKEYRPSYGAIPGLGHDLDGVSRASWRSAASRRLWIPAWPCRAGTACLPFCPPTSWPRFCWFPFSATAPGAASGHCPGDPGVPVHRLDVRAPDLPGQRP